MPNREDEYWRGEKENLRYCYKHKRYYRADVGCQLCGYGFSETKGEKGDNSTLIVCPECRKKSLFWNKKTELYECLNIKCKRKFTTSQLIEVEEYLPSPADSTGKSKLAPPPREATKRTILAKFPHLRLWHLSYWFRTIMRTLKSFLRKLPKLLILLAAFAIAAIVVAAVCLFIAKNLKVSTLIILVICGLIILVWELNSVSKHHLGLTRAFMILLISCLFIIVSSAYLDLRTPKDIADAIMGAFSTEEGQFRSTVDLLVQRAELRVVDLSSVTEEQETIEEANGEVATTEHVYIDGGILVGADGQYITLQNNPNATNPSWEELKTFLLGDRTDSKHYDIDNFVCADFAEMLHNNAEEAGIKAAYVSIWLGPCSYYPLNGGHALNAFETVDQGLVFIDCTGSNQGINADKIVEVEVGNDYVPRSIFLEPGWSAIWGNMGTIENIEVIQW